MIALILAGGEGRRLWPISNGLRPKHVLKLFDGLSLFQKSVKRIHEMKSAGQRLVDRISIVTNHSQVDILKSQLAEVNIQADFIIEPSPMNTAPAVAMALFGNPGIGDGEIVGVFPCDHIIRNEEKFAHCVARGMDVCIDSGVCTLGIPPSRPETGYGYLEFGPSTEDPEDGQARSRFENSAFPETVLRVCPVVRFVEKPDEVKAAYFIESGRFLWNAGIFIFSAGVMRHLFLEHLPKTVSAVHSMIAAVDEEMGRVRDIYSQADRISIDFGIMERISNITTVVSDIGWSDMGSFDSIHDLNTRDDSRNVTAGMVVADNCSNCLIISGNRPIGTRNLRDLIVVESDDGVLVIPRGDSQSVRSIVDSVEQTLSKPMEKDVEKPWGSFHVMDQGPGYKVKRLVVFPGAELSLQSHASRDEKWTIVRGRARVTIGAQIMELGYGQTVSIQRKVRHRLGNIGSEILEIIEVQTGEYFGEDDIIRYQDRYNRV